ncbi:hypothetical protein SuNHUV7_20100 (plasmid) [Pseudoseohaeicola sp. NH-UV-7]|uniref:hypothetical protein n=1 Tax=Sulfitobacter sp. TBRI5 TaxID=2989732 RepID=UPI003A68602A
MRKFLVQTFVAGILLFIPVFFLAFALLKVFEVIKKIVGPLVEEFDIDTVAGLLILNALAVLALAVMLFLLGLLAYLPAVSSRVGSLDRLLSDRVPGYLIIKGIIQGRVLPDTSANNLKSVLVKYNDTAQIGFEVERTPSGEVIVFLPNVPNPQTGRAAAFKAEDVEPLTLPPHKLVEALSFFGKGIGGEVAKARERRNTSNHI